jgi:hypothetical protein
MVMKEGLTAERKRYRLARTLGSYVRQLMMYVRGDAESYSSLETSSYPDALQGEPVRCLAHFARQQIVTRLLPFESDFRAR